MSKFEVNKYCATEVKSVFDFRFSSHLNPFDGGLGTAPKSLRIRVSDELYASMAPRQATISVLLKDRAQTWSIVRPFLLLTCSVLPSLLSKSSVFPPCYRTSDKLGRVSSGAESPPSGTASHSLQINQSVFKIKEQRKAREEKPLPKWQL